MSFYIVSASFEDAEVIRSLTRAAFAEYDNFAVRTSAGFETLESVREEISKGGAILVWAGEKPVGTARYHLEPDYFYVGRLAVLPECRGSGIGRAMMLHMEEIARKLNRSEIRLSTRESQPQNVRFYQGLGYIITETEPHPRGPDTIVHLAKKL